MIPPGIEQLADLLSDESMREAFKLARLVEAGGVAGSQVSGSETLGIWSYSADGDEYVRDEKYRAQWFNWADVPRIARRKSKRHRIVFLGESVARGFLYDGSFSPARVLQETLTKFARDDDYVEVIDLSKLRMGFELRELTKAAMDLSPDLLILFAGNNWFPLTPELLAERKLEVYGALCGNGVAGLAALATDTLQRTARDCIGGVRALCTEHDVPALWIVPEFNLADWQDQESPPTGVSATAVAQWYRLLAQARDHLKRGARDQAVAAAEEMLRIDEGRSGVAHRVIAQAALIGGSPAMAAARTHLEQCRDVAIFQPIDAASASPFLYTPRCFRAVAELLKAQSTWSEVVDLREVFSPAPNTALPDRSLFLDYCHMTSHGIRVAMCATAARVVKLFEQDEVPIGRFEALCPLPHPSVEAEAATLAAIENAHYGQSQEVCSYFCERAIAHDASILPVMSAMARLYLHDIPCVLSSEYQTLLESSFRNLAPFVARLGHPRAGARLARAVQDAAVAAGQPPPSFDALLRDALEPTQNLLGFFLATDSLPSHESSWIEAPYKARRFRESTRDYFVAHSPVSHFRFWHERSAGGVLSLVVRRPCSETTFGVSLNDRPLTTLPLRPEWASAKIEIRENALAQGWNDLRLHWPQGPYGEPDARGMASRILEQGGVPDIYPGWGQVFELTFSRSPSA